jgi:hypothetical protein
VIIGVKNMDLKKIVPVLAIMAMMCVCVVSMQPASAAHQTAVKAYTFDPNNPPGDELETNLNIQQGDATDLAATLHVDGGGQQWFRYIHFYVYNSNGDQIANEERNSGFGGVARCWINSRSWEPGTYKISIIYWGNDDDGYPRADKDLTLHIV